MQNVCSQGPRRQTPAPPSVCSPERETPEAPREELPASLSSRLVPARGPAARYLRTAAESARATSTPSSVGCTPRSGSTGAGGGGGT